MYGPFILRGVEFRLFKYSLVLRNVPYSIRFLFLFFFRAFTVKIVELC